MAPQELVFEQLYFAPEVTRGTPIAVPTRNIGMMAMVTPWMNFSAPNDASGTLYARRRAYKTREGTEWTADGEIDLNQLHSLMAGALKGGVSGSLVETGVYSWVYTPSASVDDLKTFTFFWGDPNTQIWQTALNYIEELKISSKGSGTAGATISVKGKGKKLAEIASPSTIPLGNLLSLPPARMDFWLDTAATAFGTTSLTDRVLDVDLTIPTGLVAKYGPGGQVATDPFSPRRMGRTKWFPKLEVTMEVLDDTQILSFLAAAPMRARVRLSTEGLIGSTEYGEVVFDITGPLEDPKWGELEGVNRTVTFTINGQYDATTAANCKMTIQNNTAVV